MKFFKAAFLLLAFGIMIFIPHFIQQASADNGDKWAEQTILTYIEAQGLDIHPDTGEYNIFLRGILLGDAPELTKPPSAYIKNDTEKDYIMRYAAENYHSAQELLFPNTIEVPVFEAVSTKQDELVTINSSSIGPSNAITYAYTWAQNGGYLRNPGYPDFGIDDCTNFVSQALYTGGFSQIGSGDGCEYESTTTEWYVEPNPSPSWTCIGDTRYWEWATSWSYAPDFLTYSVNSGFAVNRGYTYSAATAKSILSPGDIVQMQRVTNGVWTTFHTMLATKEDSNDLYVTYHSGGTNGDIDYVDRPLSNIPTSNITQRFLLVQLTYPDFIFSDVPPYYWAWNDIERIYSASITSGCSTNPLRYCPESTLTRAQMAVFILRGEHGSSYTPPPASGTVFNDVPANAFAAAWIEQLAAESITSGCGNGNYCPNLVITHAEMAVFLLRARYGSTYVPPNATGAMFNDVPSNHWAAKWIEDAANKGFSYGAHGCTPGYFCPAVQVTRAEMAGMLVPTFDLP